MRSALTDPLPEASVARENSLGRALRRQRSLAWSLSLLTLTLTVGFFALMTLAAPLLSRVVFGHSVTLANVLAVAIIVVFMASIGAFSWHATRVDRLLAARAAEEQR